MALFARRTAAVEAAHIEHFTTGGMYVPPTTAEIEAARPKRVRSKFLPAWHIIFFIYFVLLVRILAMAHMGPVTYQARIDDLQQGNFIERMTAKVMYVEPISQSIGTDLRLAIGRWSEYAASGNWKTRDRERHW